MKLTWIRVQAGQSAPQASPYFSGTSPPEFPIRDPQLGALYTLFWSPTQRIWRQSRLLGETAASTGTPVPSGVPQLLPRNQFLGHCPAPLSQLNSVSMIDDR
jgi:hypothetical protein